MGAVLNYRDLKVWQKSMELADMVFTYTGAMPANQRYVLCSQMERCAISVPANIAEGRARHSEKDFQYHLSVARGSLAELETLLLFAHKRFFVTAEQLETAMSLAEEITKMVYGLKNSLGNQKVSG